MPRILCTGIVLGLFPLFALAQTSASGEPEGDTLSASGALAARSTYDQQDDSIPELMDLVRGALDEQDYKRAVHYASRVLKQNPEHLGARYLRGIAYREKEKSYTLQTNSLTDFEFIIARDSLFRDVLAQYGLTLAYRNQFAQDRKQAIVLAERQLELAPESPEAMDHLFEIYERFVRQIHWKRARRWLEERGTAYAAFFTGKLLHRHEQLPEADSVFATLLQNPREVPQALILLAQARTRFALDDPESAQYLIDEAFAAIDTERTARLIFEDFKYIVTLNEWAQYQRLRTVKEYRTFFRTMWTKRDPMPAEPVNARLAEHYRRLDKAEREFIYSGFRGAYSDPIATRYLDFPSVYELGAAFDDRGIIYVRHGEPDEQQSGFYAEGWTYYNPAMSFFFKVQTTQSSEAGGFDELSGVGNMRLQSLHYQALTTDHHKWTDEVVPFDFPHIVAAFRGENGDTRVEVYYVLPVGALTKVLEPTNDHMDIHVGLALHDFAWREVGSSLVTKQPPTTDDASAGTVERFRLEVQSGPYHMALHTRSGHARGHYNFDYRVPNFSGSGLQVSDILPAYTITPTDPAEDATGHGLNVLPNPSRRFSTDQPVYVYFEIYNLTYGATDRTRYSLEYTLEPIDEDRGLLDFFTRDDRSTLSVKSTLEGTERSPVEYIAIDVSDVVPGRYRLRLTVTDEHLGRSVERVQEIELVED